MKLTPIIFVTSSLFLSVYADKCPRGYEEPDKQTAVKVMIFFQKDCGIYNICLKERCCEGVIADPERDYGLKCPEGKILLELSKTELKRNFCSSGSNCVEGNIFAGCCQ
ncbi:hypothetical protein CAEBREN_05173 [Caenorhabditis brenneri]|uniref:Uncharacterized protein n=1 Tax=Caenorhabditis brenneri TaxID=135651 RepID=G0M8T4_CAEBE|nr:hypothetical protein CAEBREN_05173 [Caenorhabditis brenneri]